LSQKAKALCDIIGASIDPIQEEADRWSYPAAGVSMSRAVLVEMIKASGSSPDSIRAAHPLFQAYFGISIPFAKFALAAPPEWYAQQAALENRNFLLSNDENRWQAKSEANKEFGLDLSTDKLKDWFQVDSLKIWGEPMERSSVCLGRLGSLVRKSLAHAHVTLLDDAMILLESKGAKTKGGAIEQEMVIKICLSGLNHLTGQSYMYFHSRYKAMPPFRPNAN